MIGALARRVLRIPPLPAVVWVAALMLTLIGILAFGAGSARASERVAEARRRAAAAEALAIDATMRAMAYRRDQILEQRKAAAERHRADSLAALYADARARTVPLVARATASRSRVDTTGLAPELLEALADADSLRLSVTPTLELAAATVASYQATVVRLERGLELAAAAAAEDSAGLAARAAQVHALEAALAASERRRAPRCGWRCGAVAGAVSTLVVRELAQELLDAVLRQP